MDALQPAHRDSARDLIPKKYSQVISQHHAQSGDERKDLKKLITGIRRKRNELSFVAPFNKEKADDWSGKELKRVGFKASSGKSMGPNTASATPLAVLSTGLADRRVRGPGIVPVW